jgi:HEAT repeat protein
MQDSEESNMKTWMVLICVLGVLRAGCLAQTRQEAPQAQSAPADATTDNGEEPDDPAGQPAKAAPTSVESGTNEAWEMLKTAFSDSKTKEEQARIDAVTAIGTLSDFEQARKWLQDAGQDPDRHVRLAAVAAMGTSKKEIFVPDLKAALEDSAPEVSFAAAIALWKMHDHSGEKILYAVLGGERKPKQGFVGSELHEADQDLHSPSKLATIGAEQGAFALLGPFGYGLTAIKMSRNGNNANSVRVLTATLLEEDKSEVTMYQFLHALEDHDYVVRAAAARGLGDYRGKQITDALQEAFGDPKPLVRLMAAASYIRATHPVQATQNPRHRSRSASKSSVQTR